MTQSCLNITTFRELKDYPIIVYISIDFSFTDFYVTPNQVIQTLIKALIWSASLLKAIDTASNNSSLILQRKYYTTLLNTVEVFLRLMKSWNILVNSSTPCLSPLL